MKKNNKSNNNQMKQQAKEILLDMEAIALAYNRREYWLIMTPERIKELARCWMN